MLLQSLRALCLAPGGPGSIWKNLEALVRATGVSGRCACGFRTDLHFADVKDSAQGRDECEYAYPAGKVMISGLSAPEVLLVEAGGVPGVGGVCCLRQLGGGAPDTLHLQRV